MRRVLFALAVLLGSAEVASAQCGRRAGGIFGFGHPIRTAVFGRPYLLQSGPVYQPGVVSACPAGQCVSGQCATGQCVVGCPCPAGPASAGVPQVMPGPVTTYYVAPGGGYYVLPAGGSSCPGGVCPIPTRP